MITWMLTRKRKRETISEEEDVDSDCEDQKDFDVGAMTWEMGGGDPTSGALGFVVDLVIRLQTSHLSQSRDLSIISLCI